tara:strand:- start:28118 stop:28570 length:453 start_codon:yes stop_codon:yes gene_type:complete
MDASYDFEALKRLRDKWSRRLIVKGLSRADDVKRCAEIGVDAVILSNHGGRQLDSASSALATLQEVATSVDIPVFVDGGVQRGSDVLKSLCLGANMVGLGRVLLYALAAEGEAGVQHCLSLLKSEIDRDQAMLGAPDLTTLTPDLIWQRP